MSNESGCPFTAGGQKSQPRHMPSNRDWWPHYLNLSILHQHTPQANPMGEEFNYAEEFKSLDLAALRSDGTDLREPGRPRRRTRSDRLRARYSRNLWSDGDERRGDSRAHRRWAHVRQMSRCGRGDARRCRSWGCHHHRSGPRLEESL